MKKLLSLLLAIILLTSTFYETIFAISNTTNESIPSTTNEEFTGKDSTNLDTLRPRSIIHPARPSTTYRFYDGEHELINEIQIITNEGGILFEPEIPEHKNQKFVGWFIEENGILSDKEIKFVEGVAEIEPDSNLTTDKDINVVAKFEDSYHVSFMQKQTDKWIIAHKIFGKPGDTISTKNIPITLGDNQSIESWYYNPESTGEPVGDTVTLKNENLKLYPKVVEGHFINYHVGEDSLSHFETQFYKSGEITQAPTEKPTRLEYTFKHWSESENGDPFVFGNQLDKNITLYAVWEESDIPYTISVWTQSVDNHKDAKDPLDIEAPTESENTKSYNVAKTIERKISRQDLTDYISSHPKFDNKDVAINEYISSIVKSELDKTQEIPEGFHYVEEDIEVLPKSNQPRNATVRLDRNLLTINFKDSSGSITKSFTGLYGQHLSKYNYSWPQGNQNNYREEIGNKRRVTLLDSFHFSGLAASQNKYPNDTLNLVFSKDENLTKKIVHFKEELDGSYKELDIINTRSYAGFTITDKYPGFLADQYRLDNGEWKNIPRIGDKINLHELSYKSSLEIKHKRQNFKISFNNNGAVEKSISIPYEKNISESINSDTNLKSYIEQPTRPKNIPNNFIFKGWFLDETGVEEFDFNKSMPRVNLVAFGLWEEPILKVNVFENKQLTSAVLSSDVHFKNKVKNFMLPTIKNSTTTLFNGNSEKVIKIPDGYKWIGWLVKENDVYRKFDINTPVIRDINLYPYYTNDTSFIVTYYSDLVDGKLVGKSFTSGNQYANGSTTIVLGHKDIDNPPGKYFIGWKNIDDNKIYYPGDKIEITNNNIKLVAQWSDKISKVKVVYRSGLSGDSEVIKEKLVNEKIYLEKPIFKKDGLKFIGWKNLTDNKVYEPQSILQVNKVEEETQNILVAQWVKELTLTKKWVDGESKRPENITLVLKQGLSENLP
ncbi:InlB B-repeat-containing protein, partial [Peptoniphilus asaccharolyticus]